MLDTKVEVFHESILCFMKWPWNCISWNALKEKFHSLSFPLSKLNLLFPWRNEPLALVISYSHWSFRHICPCNCFLRKETQKQPMEVFYYKKYYQRKAPVLEPLLIKLLVLACNFLKKDFNTSFSVALAKFLKTPILKNICQRLLLKIKESLIISRSNDADV